MTTNARSFAPFRQLLLLAIALVAVLFSCGGVTDLSVSGGGGSNVLETGGGGNVIGTGGQPGGDEVTSSDSGGSPGASGTDGEGGASEAALIALEVTPAVASIAQGTQGLLTATGVYADGSTEDVTAAVTWTSAEPSIASVASGVVAGVAPGTTAVSANLDGLTGSSQVTVPDATVVSLSVTPSDASVGISGTVAFNAVVTLTDGTTQDVTQTATWSSSPVSIASIASGTATGLAPGETTISATSAGVTGSATLTVTSATLVSIAVTPTNPTTGVGISLTFVATGTFSDGSVANVSSSATWSSSDSAVAQLDSESSTFDALTTGTSTITASVGSLSGSTLLTVSDASLDSIEVSPLMNTIAVDGTVALVATGTYSDGTSFVLTQNVVWTSSSSMIAAVSNASGSQGVVQGLSGGTVTVTATLQGVSGVATVKVTAATLESITLSPEEPTLPLDTGVSMSALGTYSDGSQIDITSMVSWSTTDATIASVSNATGSKGALSANAAGVTEVSAELDGVTASTTVTVTSATVVSITVAPVNVTLSPGATRTMTATATFSDGSSVDLTDLAVWTTSNQAAATVSNAGGTRGLVAAVAEGTTTITATFDGVSGSTSVTVAEPTLEQLVIDPIAASVPAGEGVRYSATAIYSDNTQHNVTNQATWASSDTSVATLSQDGFGGMGPGGVIASTHAAGTTTISATYQGITGSTSLTVTNATVSEIVVTPANPQLPVGTRQQLTATVIYSDKTSQTVTGQATWESADTSIAQVASGGGGPGGGTSGRVTALGPGQVVISASWGGVTGSTTLTVTSATLVRVDLTPTEPSVPLGSAVQFTASALFSDDTVQNVTNQATWTSSDIGVASVTTSGNARGEAQSLAAGATTIEATWNGVTGSMELAVTDAILTEIQVTPFQPTLLIGFATELVATGIYSDFTTLDLTSSATWTSSNSSVVAVSNATATKGQLSPLAAGTSTVKATFQGVTGQDAVTVSSATITSISVTPASVTLAEHATQAFTARATLSDATTLDVSNYVTWLSSTPGVASISNASGSRGVATALSTGTVTVTAIRSAVSGTASLTVQ